MIVVVYAHPYPRHSRACAALAKAVEGIEGVQVRSLYDRYPDFDVDAEAERAALAPARLVAWLHPTYWYTAPALLHLWFERVLVEGWAYGEGGAALRGKDCLWITTTGGDEAAYTPAGRHAHPFAAFVPAVEQTARFCGMNWLEPFVVHGAHIVDDASLAASGERLRRRFLEYAGAANRAMPGAAP
jgi:glutathione-regulated potassium-efflux system ancillary protein KefF